MTLWSQAASLVYKCTKKFSGGKGSDGGTVAVVRMDGPIMAGGRMNKSLNLRTIKKPLEKAFTNKKFNAVAIILNSPGGAPVQSSLIANAICELKNQYPKKVYIFIEDVCASGGYWIASAGDEIYANPASLVGSIGVVSAGFGFHNFIKEHGIERRIYSAGENKVRLDPFSASKEEDREWLASLQQEMHSLFIQQIKTQRGDKLNGQDAQLFNGDVWLAAQAKELGLIDALGDLDVVMRHTYGDKVKLVALNPNKSGFAQMMNSRQGSALSDGVNHGLAQLPAAMMDEVELRAQWARYGL